MARFAEVTDVTLANGNTEAGPEAVVENKLDVASARLRRLVPSLEARMADDEDLAILAKDTVIEAVLRRLRGNGQGVAEVSAVTRSAGPFSETTNFRGPRNDYFTLEELAALRIPVGGMKIGTIQLHVTGDAPAEIASTSRRALDARTVKLW